MTVTTAHDEALDILSGMAVSLRHELDLDFVLAELATGVRHTLDAERVSVLLLDDDGRLTPAVAVARQHNDELWQRFRMLVGQVRRLLRDATELLVTVRTDELIAAAGDGPVRCFVVPAPLRAAEPAPKSGNVATSGQTGQAL